MDIYKMREMKNAIRRIESTSKVTGTAQYLDDLEMQGMAYGGIIRSPYPHAKVLSIDFSEVKKMPGVLGTLTPDDVPQVHFNVTGSLKNPSLIEDQSILTWHPLHEGDRICAVVAEDKETLHRALEAVKIEYEVLPTSMTIDQSIKEGARIINPEFYQDNFYCHKVGTRGEVEEGFEKSDYIFEGTYRTPTQHPIPMEPVSCIAYWNRDNKLHTWATSQVPYQDRRILAAQFGIPESDVSCHRAMIGGAFGAREEMYHQDVAAALSRLIYRPVKIINNRSDEMTATAVRHASYSKVKMGCTKDGQMVAFHQVMYTNGGSYCTHSPLVTAAPDRKMPYHMPYFRYDGIGVATNAAVSGAFRGYGNPQGTFGRESLINDACREMGWDPIKFRYDNVLKPGEKVHGCAPLSTFPADEVFGGGLRLQKEIDEKEGLRDDDEVKEAWGMALCSHTSSISSLQGLTGSSIICLPDGSVSLMTGTTDMGNGSETAMVQVCAEKLGMDLCDVRHADLDTSTSPYNIGSYSSGQMFLTGNAVAMACEEVIRKAKVELAKLYNVPVEQVLWRDKMFHIVYPGKRMTFKEAILDISRGCLNMFIMGSAVAHLEDAPEPFALCWAKVAYYKKENAIKLKHIIESVDVGRVMNPLIVKGQLEGEIQMGVGFALMEDLEVDPITKKYVSADLLNYRNPLILDMPEVHLFVADSFEPRSANGTKSVGELGLIPVAPAITDAVIRASGKKITELPLSRQFYIKNNRYDDFFEEGLDK